MKGIVAICFFLLAAAASVSGKPGGYTAANDVIKVKFDESKWGEAKRAGEWVIRIFCQKNLVLNLVSLHQLRYLNLKKIKTDLFVRNFLTTETVWLIPTLTFDSFWTLPSDKTSKFFWESEIPIYFNLSHAFICFQKNFKVYHGVLFEVTSKGRQSTL